MIPYSILSIRKLKEIKIKDICNTYAFENPAKQADEECRVYMKQKGKKLTIKMDQRI